MNVSFGLAVEKARLKDLMILIDGAVEDYEALRTVYLDGPAGPVQLVQPSYTVVPDRLSGVDAIAAWVQLPLDLAELPALRAAVVDLPDGEVWVHIASHHLALDGESAAVLRMRLQAQLDGNPTPFPIGASLADIATAEADEASQARRRELEIRLHEAIRHVPPRNLVPIGDSQPGTLSLTIASREFTNLVKQAARDAAATPAAVMLGLYALIIHLLGDRDACHIRVQTSNRSKSSWRHTVGLLVQSVPTALPCAPESTGSDLIAAARAGVFRAIAEPMDFSWSDYYSRFTRQCYADGCAPGAAYFNFFMSNDLPTAADGALVSRTNVAYGDEIMCDVYSNHDQIPLKVSLPWTSEWERRLRLIAENHGLLMAFLQSKTQSLDGLRSALHLPRANPTITLHRYSSRELQRAALAVLDYPGVVRAETLQIEHATVLDVVVDRPATPASLHWHIWRQIAHGSELAAPDSYRIRHGGRTTAGTGRKGRVVLAIEPPVNERGGRALHQAFRSVGISPRDVSRNLILAGNSAVDAITVALRLPKWTGVTPIDLLNPYLLTREVAGRMNR